MNDDFTVPMNGLAQGLTEFRWRAGDEFFARFENSEILGADLDVAVSVEKSGSSICVDCEIEGSVTVVCDRCLEDLQVPVSAGFSESVKFGSSSAEDADPMEGEREVVFLAESDAVLDLSQSVYDYVCLSLPVKKVHEEGGCNPETLKYLSSDDGSDKEENAAESPFAKLREMMEKK